MSSAVTLSSVKKAQTLNDDPDIYGTFAEIGAGQEVVRHFFRAGHASNTIAKTISAYDMSFSDEIYGKSKRYVSKERLLQMLDHEYQLVDERLQKNCPEKKFFAFANTVATGSRDSSGHAWMGIRYQLTSDGPANDIIIHIQLNDRLRLQKQEVLGIIGVNLMYAAVHHADDLNAFIVSLIDNVSRNSVEIDYINFKGKSFNTVCNTKANLQLVNEKLTSAVLFNEDGQCLQASDYLFNKSVLVQRGTFRPITKTNIDILSRAQTQLKNEGQETQPLMEISLDKNLPDKERIQDTVRRVKTLTALKLPILVSRHSLYSDIKAFLRRCSNNPINMVIGANTLEPLFDESYYENTPGGILEALGKTFDKNTQILVFPYKTNDICMTTKSFFPKENITGLYSYLKANKHIVDILDCDDVQASMLSTAVREMLAAKNPDWKKLVPAEVVNLIEENQWFT